jgi:hypothetical protein
MSDLLTRMTERTLGLAPTLQPKLTSTYESSSPMLGDGWTTADTPEVVEDLDTGLAADLTGINTQINNQINTVVAPRSNVPTSIVVTAQPNLVISRLSHNLSGADWQNAPSLVTNVDPIAAPVTPADSSIPEITVAPATSLEFANLAIDSPSLLPLQPSLPEVPNEIAEPLTTAALVPQSAAHSAFTVANNYPTPEQSELTIIREISGTNLTRETLSTPHPSSLPQETSLCAPAPLLPSWEKGLGDEGLSMLPLEFLPHFELIPENPTSIAPLSSSSPLSQTESLVNLVTNATQIPAANQPSLTQATIFSDSGTIESPSPIPSGEKLITEISTVSPMAASPQLISAPDRTTNQTLVPLTVANNSPPPEQSELTITRENPTSIAPLSSSSPPIGSPVNLVTNVTQIPAAEQPNLSQVAIPSRERLITEISTVSPVAASPQLISAPDRKAIQTLVPITVHPIDRPSTSPAPQIPSQPAAPTIQIKIGRIEIRAVTTPPPAAPPKSRPSSVPQLSLADYLKSRGSST